MVGRRKLAAGAAGIAALAVFGLTQGGGTIDVFVGSTPTPTATATATPTPTPTPSAANLYMDTSGGTCTRDAEGDAAYNDAAACDSLAEALTSASAGDTIIVRTGSTFTAAEGVTDDDSPGTTGNPVEIWSEASATFDDLDLSNEDYIDFHNLSVVKTSTPASNDDKVIDLSENNDHISFYDSTLDVNWKITDGLGISGGNSNILWSGGWIKHAVNEKLIEVDTYNAPGQQTDITFEDCELGDMGYSATSYGGEPPHGEIFWLQQTTRFTIRRCTLLGSISTGNMNWGGDGNNLDYLISNTVWGNNYVFTSGVDIAPGSAVAYRSVAGSGQNIQGDNLNGTGTIEYSVFHGSIDLSGQTITYRGNIDQASGCEGGITYTYNIHTAANCSASDVQDATIFSDFTSVGSGTGGWDYTPANAGSGQCGAGNPGSYPATDLLGVTRSSPPDAGPYEC